MHFDHPLFLFLTPPISTFLSTPSQSVLYLFNCLLIPICASSLLMDVAGGGSLEHRKHTSDHKVKENWLSSAKMSSTEIVPQLGIGAGQLPFFIPEVSLFWSCVGNHSFWEFMSTAVLSCPKYIVLLWSSPICVS